MRIGAFQFASGCDIAGNFEKMRAAVFSAAEQKVRLLIFPECALTGYPMGGISRAADTDFAAAEACIAEFGRLAEAYGMYLAVGTISREDNGLFNTIRMVSPDGKELPAYNKRALWGWDLDNFVPGGGGGVYEIDGFKLGVRLCFEVRFPEYFRELYKAQADLCLMSFCDITDEDDIGRYELIKAHLRTRAVENIMTIISVNNIGPFQSAPTAVFDIDGNVVSELERNKEGLLVYDYETPEKQFGARGREYVLSELLEAEK